VRILLPVAMGVLALKISLTAYVCAIIGGGSMALLICAWLVAFFPILSNTVVGLNSADHNLRDLFRLYGASKGQTLVR